MGTAVISCQLPVTSEKPGHHPARAPHWQLATNHWQLPKAFTLTEVMIAIALVLILIVGVAQVFQMTSQAVSSGQALQALTRDARAAESAFSNDVQSMLTHTDQPALIIWNQRHAAFLDENHEKAEYFYADAPGDYWEHQDRILTVDSGGASMRVPAAIYNERNHRVDILGFFTSNFYRRQTPGTAGDSLLPPDETANEAFVWYGHLLPPDSGARIGTPEGYARDWILGRQAILLNPESPRDYAHWQALVDLDAPDFAAYLRTSRFDVARGGIRDIVNHTLHNSDWWRDGFLFRFLADPHLAAPVAPDAVAATTPIFLTNVTSIIVEYAGDFLNQVDKDDSRITAPPNEAHLQWGAPVGTYNSQMGSDGQIDFVYHPARSPDAVKQIRWYGLPRDVNSDVQGEPGKPDGAIFSTDVIPLRDLWVLADDALVSQGFDSVGRYAPFEREPGEVYPDLRGVLNRITEGTTPANGYANPTDGMQPDEAYYCAWGPHDRKPMLIRITLVMHDPQGRLPEGQTFQYVLRVPGS